VAFADPSERDASAYDFLHGLTERRILRLGQHSPSLASTLRAHLLRKPGLR